MIQQMNARVTNKEQKAGIHGAQAGEKNNSFEHFMVKVCLYQFFK
jgi:hypothetical protein